MTHNIPTPEAVERVARAICHECGRMPDVIVKGRLGGHPAWRDYENLATAAIRAIRDSLTDQMRFAVWFDQYQFLGASEAESAIVATKRFVDEEQKAQDLRAFQAMMNAALGEMPEGMRAAFAGAKRLRFTLTDAGSPALITPEGRENGRAVLMPMRV